MIIQLTGLHDTVFEYIGKKGMQEWSGFMAT